MRYQDRLMHLKSALFSMRTPLPPAIPSATSLSSQAMAGTKAEDEEEEGEMRLLTSERKHRGRRRPSDQGIWKRIL